MSNLAILVAALRAATPSEVLEKLEMKGPLGQKAFFVTSGVKPVDLYCYLQARFGAPNGLLSFLRKDDSNNLFHWHYSLRAGVDWLDIMASTYRIELHLPDATQEGSSPA